MENWLARLDPRAKILGILVVIICTTFVKGPLPLSVCCLAACALLLAARLGPRHILVMLLAVPAMTFAVAVPAALNLVTEGQAVVTLCRLGGGSLGPWTVPPFLTITDNGLYVATRLVLRATACVSFAWVLTRTTRPHHLMRGIRDLGVPSPFVMVGSMTLRYMGFLLRSAEQVHLAKLSRSIRPLGVGREQAWAAAGLGEIYSRSRRMADSVTRAMVSRGFRGDAVALASRPAGLVDALFVLGCICFGGGMLWAG